MRDCKTILIAFVRELAEAEFCDRRGSLAEGMALDNSVKLSNPKTLSQLLASCGRARPVRARPRPLERRYG